MVCSIWKHIAVLRDGSELANHSEHMVKRACFKWGLGRELYDSPFIWVPSNKCNLVQQGNKWTCYDKCKVAKIAVESNEYGRKRITGIRIVEEKTGNIAFSWRES